MIKRRHDQKQLAEFLDQFPVTAILGPRQCGKTTLARQHAADHYFDLENPRDVQRLSTAQTTLENLSGLIVIDEIQRAPELFPLLRYLVDTRAEQRYLVLGSASRDLIQQSSESLAGRIAYHHLGGFAPWDVGNWRRLWTRGGFPRSYLAPSDSMTHTWMEQYIAAFLERDLPQLGISLPAHTLRRFWTMLAHYHGQILNYSEFARSFGVSHVTARRYVEILEGTFMVRQLRPWHANVKKRIVKAPKLYVRDPGIFHYLMGIETHAELTGHPKLGASWEGFALETVARASGKDYDQLHYWRTHGGAELDLFWQHKGRNWGAEFKYTDAPCRTRSMASVQADLGLAHLWVVYPGDVEYPIDNEITALPLSAVGPEWPYPAA